MRAFIMKSTATTTLLALVLVTGCAETAAVPPPQNPPADAPPPSDAPPPDQAAPGGAPMAVDDFVQPLAQYGTWVDDPTYGRVWKPSPEAAGSDFAPYSSDGTWVENDDGGWVFESAHDNEWGWATYHYGRWLDVDGTGWVWVPGTVWGPSWVEWRSGGGYVGWVPMGPPGVVVAESRWSFVEERRFGEPGMHGHRLPPDRIHGAFVASSPIVEVRAGGWSVGPSGRALRAAGASVRTTHAAPPSARGSVAARGSAGASGGRSAPRSAAPAAAGHAAAAPRPASGPAPAPAAHHSAPPSPAPASHAAPAHHAAPPPAPAPRPKPSAPPPAPKPRPSSGGGRHK
jgi:hypothetical protein